MSFLPQTKHLQSLQGVGLHLKFVPFSSIDLWLRLLSPHFLPCSPPPRPPSSSTISGLFHLFAILGEGFPNTKQFLLSGCLLWNKFVPQTWIVGPQGSRQNCYTGTPLGSQPLPASTLQHHTPSSPTPTSFYCPSWGTNHHSLRKIYLYHLQSLPTPVPPSYLLPQKFSELQTCSCYFPA